MGIAREIYGASGAIEPLFRWIPHGRPVFTAGQSDPFGAVEEPKTFVGLPNGGYAIIGAATESISVYDATGTFLRSALADLDAAYASKERAYRSWTCLPAICASCGPAVPGKA